MRILSVRLGNLNSLAGEWAIDFTHPAYAGDGVFAITGPTGAGKTTLFDAICLALYGRTPRLARVNKGGNEIMSRQTGECFAEVTFRTPQGCFRCHWSQRRANRKPDGALQSPRHEIADADSGQLLASRVADMGKAVETRAGMDFARFTRSMLLAQGDFAAFLLAAPDERAPILEQITGTEIYSRISMEVFARRGEEKKKLELLDAELAGCALLAPEAETALRAALAEKNHADQETRAALARCRAAIDWQRGMRELETSLAALARQEKDLVTRRAAFAPEQEKLAAARHALELAADYERLETLRRADRDDLAGLETCRAILPREEAAIRAAAARLRDTAAALATARTEQRDAQPAIRRARELDRRIGEKEAAIDALRKNLAERAGVLAAQKSEHARDRAEHTREQERLAQLAARMQETRADAALVETLAGFAGRFEHLREQNQRRREKEAAHAGALNVLREATRAWETLAARLAQVTREAQAAEMELKTLEAAQDERLSGETLANWRKRHLALLEEKSTVIQAGEAARTRAEARAALEALVRRGKTLDAEKTALDEKRTMFASRHAALEKEKELLETQLNLLQNIADLREARHLLRDGEPCPLCGATAHPFASEKLPCPDATRQRLDTVIADWKSAGDALLEIQVKVAETGKDMERVAADEQAWKEQDAAARRVLEILLESIVSAADTADTADTEMTPDLPELATRLDTARARLERQCVETAGILEMAEAADRILSERRIGLEKLRDARVAAERETQAAGFARETTGQQVATLRKDTETCLAEETAQCLRLREEIRSAFGIELATVDAIDETRAQLVARRDAWLARQAEKTRLDREIARLEQKTAQQADRIGETECELARQARQLDTWQRECHDIRAERRAHFGDRIPDAEETRLARAVDSASEAMENARGEHEVARVALTRLQAKIAELEENRTRRAGQLRAAETAFAARCATAGFAGEAQYRAAILPEERRAQLEHAARLLADEATEIAARAREKNLRLEKERQRALAVEPLETLETMETVLGARYATLQQEIGGIRQKLADNETAEREQAARLAAIARQRTESLRWQALHDLIGSENGKKYRNFAQGLTFDRLIDAANRQLGKMTDRYLLTRNQNTALELDVIDNDQAGEIRSTRNLSGGESFLVSLALALGLSRMASRNVRVDSLFLDEGFGALDEETLETALEALSSLECEGRLIGIVSHVPALNARIPVQIRVVPQTGGRSRIVGPGVSRGSIL
ncbi:MAG: AAA family ATPase [Zoogloeaceae bacterium]|jgi:exonuclease SbcC|nr:AAA family ATPase [Zoogloeaceae bacterium]